MRKATAALLVSACVPVWSALPVVTLPAASAQPVAPVVWSQPAAGVADAALRSAAGAASLRESIAERAAAAPVERGGAPSRPAVLTPVERTNRFALIGATWRAGSAPASTELTVLIRTHGDDGWTPWTGLATADAPEASEGAHVRGGTEPLWVGEGDGYQLRVDVRRGVLPADLRVDLVDPGDSPADATLGQGEALAQASAVSSRPPIYGRQQWGADERLRNGGPNYTSTIKAGFVHHTATSNGYSRAEVPKIIRGIYAFHVKSNGWSDIGYNFLVDRFGRLWEGRYGGVRRPVLGAHTGGFNTDAFAVSAIGNYGAAGAPQKMVQRIANLMSWKLDLYHRNPSGHTELTSTGGGTSRYPEGKRVIFDVVSGHRDAGYTECPGGNLYRELSWIRSESVHRMGAGVLNPTASVTGHRVRVRGWVLERDHRWRVTLRTSRSGYVVHREAGNGKFDLTTSVPRDGTYIVTIQSWGGGRTARPYQAAVPV